MIPVGRMDTGRSELDMGAGKNWWKWPCALILRDLGTVGGSCEGEGSVD